MEKVVIDLDEILGWELVVRVGGVELATRAPSLLDMAAVQELQTSRNPQKIFSLGQSLLMPFNDAGEPQKPDLSAEQWMAIILCVFDYWRVKVQKNGRAIAPAVAAAVAKGMGQIDQSRMPAEPGNSIAL